MFWNSSLLILKGRMNWKIIHHYLVFWRGGENPNISSSTDSAVPFFLLDRLSLLLIGHVGPKSCSYVSYVQVGSSVDCLLQIPTLESWVKLHSKVGTS